MSKSHSGWYSPHSVPTIYSLTRITPPLLGESSEKSMGKNPVMDLSACCVLVFFEVHLGNCGMDSIQNTIVLIGVQCNGNSSDGIIGTR